MGLLCILSCQISYLTRFKMLLNIYRLESLYSKHYGSIKEKERQIGSMLMQQEEFAPSLVAQIIGTLEIYSILKHEGFWSYQFVEVSKPVMEKTYKIHIKIQIDSFCRSIAVIHLVRFRKIVKLTALLTIQFQCHFFLRPSWF